VSGHILGALKLIMCELAVFAAHGDITHVLNSNRGPPWQHGGPLPRRPPPWPPQDLGWQRSPISTLPRSNVVVWASWPCTWPRPCTVVPQSPHSRTRDCTKPAASPSNRSGLTSKVFRVRTSMCATICIHRAACALAFIT